MENEKNSEEKGGQDLGEDKSKKVSLIFGVVSPQRVFTDSRGDG